MHDVELDGVVEVPAAVDIGCHAEHIALAVFVKTRCPLAARALGALLIAGALGHEEAVVRDHELLVAVDDQAHGDGALVCKLLDLSQGELGAQPGKISAQGRPDAQCIGVGSIELGANRTVGRKLAQSLGNARGLVEVDACWETRHIVCLAHGRGVQPAAGKPALARLMRGQVQHGVFVSLNGSGTALVQGREAHAHAVIKLDVPVCDGVGRAAQTRHVLFDVVRRDGNAAGSLDQRALCMAVVAGLVAYGDGQRLAKTRHNAAGELLAVKTRHRTLAAVARKSGAANAEQAVAGAYRAADVELNLARTHVVCLLYLVGSAALGSPDLQQVTDLDGLGLLYEHHAVAKTRDTTHENAAVVGALVAHHVVAALACQVSLGETAAKGLGKAGLLFLCHLEIGALEPGAVKRFAIGADSCGDIIGRLHAALDLEGGNTCLDELGQHVDTHEVFGAQEVLAGVGKALAVFSHQHVGKPARLRAHAAVGTAAADHRAHQALAALADAQRAVDKDLEVHSQLG